MLTMIPVSQLSLRMILLRAGSREVLANYGNMSSATMLFILQRLQEEGSARPCVALGFGPGMVVEAALLE